MKVIRPVTVTDGGSFTRSSTGTYYNKSGILQTAANDTPRFSYDPSTLIPLGLLEEKAATNLLLYSEQFDNAAWTKTNSTVAANATTAPDGNATADTITATTANGQVSQSVAVTNGQAYAFTCYVKAGTSSNIRFSAPIIGLSADIDLSAGTAEISAGTGVVKIFKIGTAGWYRVGLHFTATGTTSTPTILNNNGVVGATFSLWGAQLEAITATSSSATSYFATTSAAGTRSADVNTAGMLSNVVEADYTAYSSTKVYNTGDYVMVVGAAGSGIHKIYQSLQGKSSVVTMTIAAPGVISWVSHGLTAGTPIQFSTTGALPTGITAGTTYYVASTGLATNSFSVTSNSDGTGTITTTGTQSGTHTAVAGTNINKDPASNPTYWLDSGSTNKWKAFDTSVQSQATNADVIFYAIKPGSRVDTVALLNIQGQGARIVVNDATDGKVFDQTLNGLNNDSISDFWYYFFDPIIYKSDFAVTGLPPYLNVTINVIIYNTGATAYCGGVNIGLSKDIGATQVNAKVGIQDYSIKNKDNFGNYTIVQRAYAKRANFTVYVESDTVDFLQTMLATYRATPVVYIGETTFGATIVYGFYKNFDIDIGYLDGLSVCTLELEGLT